MVKELALLLLPLVGVIVLLMVTTLKTDGNVGQQSSSGLVSGVRSELSMFEQQVQADRSASSAPVANMPLQQGATGSGPPQLQGQPQLATDEKHVHASDTEGDDETCGCPPSLAENPCSVSGEAVLGGVDVVQYFTTFKNSDGTYDTSQIGQAGSSEFASTYGGFQYYFITEANKAIFDASPESYIPQYGGFCSWGVGYESCPPYAWSATCLGPSGNWGLWTIQNSKLYFFYAGNARDNFLEDPDTYITNGDSRWSLWFSSPYNQMSTDCYVNPSAAV
jgi:YHS domain-containing protein